jgi:hypothetical protein
VGDREQGDPWWWGFRMPAWQRFVVAFLCTVVFFFMDRFEAPLWLGIPVVFVFVICIPGVVEMVIRSVRGSDR